MKSDNSAAYPHGPTYDIWLPSFACTTIMIIVMYFYRAQKCTKWENQVPIIDLPTKVIWK